MIWLLPFATFFLLLGLEHVTRPAPLDARNTRIDHALNLAGLAVQGALIPAAAYLLATQVFAAYWPHWAGSLHIGWLGAFLLNFIGIDFLYYWQHRLFHQVPALWLLHRCHHQSSIVNVWATARNSLLTNFLFVYLLFNPLLGFLCDRPDAFFAAAALTASLDLWRHARLPSSFSPAWLEWLLVTPRLHHAHHAWHAADMQAANFGANLVLWDRLFGTFRATTVYPRAYGADGPLPLWRQFLFPW